MAKKLSPFVMALLLSPLLVIFQNCDSSQHSGGGMSSLNSLESVDAFSQTLQPILRQNCVSCHGNGQGPQFAVEDANSAHSILVLSNIVSLNDPAASLMVFKISSGHNNIPETLAEDILLAIEDWVSRLDTIEELPPSNAEATYASLYTNLFEPKCLSCHNANQASGGYRYDTYQQTLFSVRFGDDAEYSLSYLVATEQLISHPPLTQAVSAQDAANLLEWIKNGASQ